MRGLKSIALIIGQVFKLVMGDNFAIPASEVFAQYPYLRFDV